MRQFQLMIVILTSLFLMSACGGSSSSGGGNTTNPPPTGNVPSICDADPDTYFADNVFPILQTRCMTCHVDGGSAPANGARWVVHASAVDTQADIDNLINIEGFQYVLDKPSGGTSHGGGTQLPSNSDDFEIFAEYVQFVGIDNFCG